MELVEICGDLQFIITEILSKMGVGIEGVVCV